MPAPKASAVANNQGVTTIAITVPATTAAGDLILIRASTNAQTTVTHNGSGYTITLDGQNTSKSELLIGKVAAAGDAGTTVTFTFGASNRVSAVCVVMPAGSFDPANPLQPTPTYTDTSTDATTLTSPAITAVSGSTVLVWQTLQGTTGAGAITWTAPPGTALVTQTSSTAAGGKNNGQGVAWVAASGASGPWTATVSQASTGRLYSLAIAPAGASGPQVTWWNGTAEVPATLTWWDGSAEHPLTSLELS